MLLKHSQHELHRNQRDGYKKDRSGAFEYRYKLSRYFDVWSYRTPNAVAGLEGFDFLDVAFSELETASGAQADQFMKECKESLT
ncbi:unnamed protein product [Protopolystoma xenopodis]|uniref:Uncharacterized protein n=1 Tax=Protopolystoma xenopodis TaxID=117903 RepID=A0A448XF96_9PLAT|nr:unnamed protein product [Protopolystoma xenopodis]